ncbi:MAG: hypothetical protein ACTSQQ_05255, partial [Candidatus Helarchaeota archaeon]
MDLTGDFKLKGEIMHIMQTDLADLADFKDGLLDLRLKGLKDFSQVKGFEDLVNLKSLFLGKMNENNEPIWETAETNTFTELKIFKSFHSLEQLNLNGSLIQSLPQNIGDLKQLRHLNLEQLHHLVSLPDSIGDLSALQELIIDISSLETLPESIGKLS